MSMYNCLSCRYNYVKHIAVPMGKIFWSFQLCVFVCLHTSNVLLSNKCSKLYIITTIHPRGAIFKYASEHTILNSVVALFYPTLEILLEPVPSQKKIFVPHDTRTFWKHFFYFASKLNVFVHQFLLSFLSQSWYCWI